VLRKLLLILSITLFAAPAYAGWLRAESQHFIVYTQGDEASARNAATRLEKLDALQRSLTGLTRADEAKKANPAKVSVYMLAKTAEVAALAGGDVLGYYSASVRGPIAVTTRENDADQTFPAELVLFHELTHHFMFQYFPATYPTWYQEGFADFIGASAIDDSNKVTIGKAVVNRYYSLRGERSRSWIPVGGLLSTKSYDDYGSRIDLLYAEGWLLTHYLNFNKPRAGQLARYLAAINGGKPFAAAATEAFGDLARLDRELQAYAELNKFPISIIPLESSDIGTVAVTPVSAAQSALMQADIRLGSGILASDAARFAQAVAKIATAFPDDPVALRIRAEADRLAGDRADEATTVAHWATVAPRDAKMLMHRAQLAVDALVVEKSGDVAAWNRAHDMMLDAHRAALKDSQILKAYFDGFVAQGVLPPVGAHNALYLALSATPQDNELRYQLAADFEKRGLIEDAIGTIRPAAYAVDDGSEKSEWRKARDKRREAKYRIAGQIDHESALAMLVRLEAAQAASAAPRPAH
jgi:hypothetical protein